MKKINVFLKFFLLLLFFISNIHLLLAQNVCDREFVITVSYDDFDECPTEICLMEVVFNSMSGTTELINVSNVIAIDWSAAGQSIELAPFQSDCVDEETLQAFQGETFTVTTTYFVFTNIIEQCTATVTYTMDCDPGCEEIGSSFNLDGSFDNWQVFENGIGDVGATLSIVEQSPHSLDGTPFLSVRDNSRPTSWVFNEVDFVGINCGTLCFDLNISEHKQGNEDFTNPQVILYAGNAEWLDTDLNATPPEGMIIGTTVEATFTADIQMNDLTGPATICTEIFEATNSLPPGWAITGGDNVPIDPIDAWNTLLADVTGLALKPEVVDIAGEVFNYDNICFDPCLEPCDERTFVVEPLFYVNGCLDLLCLREEVDGMLVGNPVWPIEWSLLDDGTILNTTGLCIGDEENFEGETVVVTFNYDGNGDGANECEQTIVFDAPTCNLCNGTDFNDGTEMNWQAFTNSFGILGAVVVNEQDANNNFDGTPFLEVTDDTGASSIFNDQDFLNINEGMLCFDIEVMHDLGGAYTPNISIYSGVMPDGIILEATFTANFTMDENSGQVNFCAPILAANTSLPQGIQGSWSITQGTGDDILDWNNLIDNNDGIALNPDFVFGKGEVIRYDNFCFTPCTSPDANCPTEPSCNCNNLTNNCLDLEIVDTPQGCGTLTAEIMEECLAATPCWDQIDWRVELGGGFVQNFIDHGSELSFDFPQLGFPSFTVVITVNVHLTNGEVCPLGTRFTRDCSYQFKPRGGRRDSSNDTDQLSEKIRLFPNPARTESSIYNPFDRVVVAQVYNTSGQELRSINLSPNSTKRLGLTDYANGVYFVHFTDQISNEYLSTEKLILVE